MTKEWNLTWSQQTNMKASSWRRNKVKDLTHFAYRNENEAKNPFFGQKWLENGVENSIFAIFFFIQSWQNYWFLIFKSPLPGSSFSLGYFCIGLFWNRYLPSCMECALPCSPPWILGLFPEKIEKNKKNKKNHWKIIFITTMA